MNFIIYDLEATCWKGRPPSLIQETIEIGAVMVNGFGEDLGSFNKFIKPVINPELSAFCSELTGIAQHTLDRAPGYGEVIEEFLDWAAIGEEDYLLCSWGKFDKRQLIADCKLHRLEWDWLEQHINLKKQYQTIKKLKNPRGLKKAVEHEGFEFEGKLHSGMADAQNLAKIFVKLIDEWSY